MRLVCSLLACFALSLGLILTGCEPGARDGGDPKDAAPQKDKANQPGKDGRPSTKDTRGKDKDKDASAKDDAKDSSAKDDGKAGKGADTTNGQSSARPTPNADGITVLQERDDRLMIALPNRMIVIAQEIPTAPVVSVQMFVKTGSIYEQEHVGAGLSHFLEHLLSGGTTTTTSEDETNKILGRIGAQVNAATSLDQVWYYINTTRDFAPDAVHRMSDWMKNSVIDKKEYDREREVIQREFQMRQGQPSTILWELMQQARYTVHPARHPIIGYIDDFMDVSRDEIYDFYRRMYVPNNMVFVVVGDIDKEKIVAQITEQWKDVEPKPLPDLSFPKESPVTKPQTLEGTAYIERPRLRLVWPGSEKLGAEGDYALDLLAVTLGQGESSRLVRTVRDQQRLVTTISAFNVSHTWGEGYFVADAELVLPKTAPADKMQMELSAVRAAILEQVERIKNEGVSEAELARAKRQTLAQVIYAAQTAEDIADRMANDIIGMGDPDFLRKYAAEVQKLTAEDVKAAANRFLNPQKLLTLKLLPSEEKIEPLERPKTVTDADDIEREPFDLDNRVVIEKLKDNVKPDAQARPVVVEKPTHHTLSNGLRLVVGRNTLIPATSIQLYQLGGLLADDPGLQGVANATAVMQTRGTETRTAQEIAQQSEDLGAAVVTRCGYNTSYARADCLADDWPAVMELLADVWQNPTFPADEWEKMQPRLIAAIEGQQSRWDTALGLKFRDTYFLNGHPWSTTTLGRKEVVSALTVENLTQFHRERLGASTSVLAVFGDVDPDAVVKEAERLFGKMPAEPKVAFNPPAPDTAPAGKVTFTTPMQTTAVQIGMGPGVERKDEDYAGIAVLTKVLDAFPGGTLTYELRMRDKGLAYAVWAYQVTGVVPGYIAAGFNCKAEDVDEALGRTLSALDAAQAEPVEPDTLARAQAAVLTGEFFSKQSNADRATDAALALLYGLPKDEAELFIKQVRSLTPEQLQSIAKEYLANRVVVILKEQPAPPEEKGEAKE